MSAILIASPLFACWLVSARLLYARWQGEGGSVSRRDCSHHGQVRYRGRDSGCCYDDAPLADGVTAALAMIVALFFPLVVLAALVRWQPHPRQRLQARKSRRTAGTAIALRPREWEREVEQEVGLGGDHDHR